MDLFELQLERYDWMASLIAALGNVAEMFVLCVFLVCFCLGNEVRGLQFLLDR